MSDRPRYVAIIMDGNARWAQNRGLGVTEGADAADFMLERPGGEPAPVTLTPIAGPEYTAALQRALSSGRFRTVVTLELGPASPFMPDWLAKWDAFGQNYVRAMTERETPADYTLESDRAFPASDAKVRIYARRDAGATGSDLARSPDRAD